MQAYTSVKILKRLIYIVKLKGLGVEPDTN